MKILPPVTKPWSATIIPRRHQPRPATGRFGFRKYRPCLRWEFSFSCAFCMCHEADLFHYGARGSGLMEVEHFLRQAEDQHPEARNLYGNCFHACGYCNRARGEADNVDAQGHRLLNPGIEVWQDAFEVFGDEVRPRPGNGDAEYTCETYAFNEPTKVRLRKRRRETIEDCMALVDREEILELHQNLLDKALDTSDPRLVETAEKLWLAHQKAKNDLRLFKAVPWDADRACRCYHTAGHSLHPVLDEQTIEVDLD